MVAGFNIFKLPIEYSKSLDNYYDGKNRKDNVKVLAFLLAAFFKLNQYIQKLLRPFY